MNWRGQLSWGLILVLAAGLGVSAAAEEPGVGYVPDPEVEKLIEQARDQDKAIAYPAIKRLTELGGSAERALNYHLFNDKTTVGRRAYAELIARCGSGRTGYRVSLDLGPDGAGKLLLESDRSLIAECARKFDRIFEKPPRDIKEDELRRNPYSKTDLSRFIENSVQYTVGDTVEKDGRVMASGEVTFSNFDDLAGFANAFDRTGYHMLSGVTLADANGLRVLRINKPAEADPKRSANYLLLFHDLKWEFVFEFKGEVKAHNATRAAGNKLIWRFNCAQMLNGETLIEVTFDPRAMPAPSRNVSAQKPEINPSQPVTDTAGPTAVPAAKQVKVKVAVRPEAGQANPNGPETILTLDGSASLPRLPGLQYQWKQTGGRPLYLSNDKLAVPVVKMRVYEVGKYTFELKVTNNDVSSDPAEVVVLVGDGTESAVADNTDGSDDGLRKTYTLPPVRKPKPDQPVPVTPPQENVASQQPAPTPPVRTPPAAPEIAKVPVIPPLAKDDTAQTKQIKVQPPKNVALPRNGILLDEIRQEEAAYNKRVAAAKGGSVQPQPPSPAPVVRKDENPVAVAERNIDPPVRRDAPAPNLEKQGLEVATARRIDLDSIRKEEAVYNKAHGIVKDAVPDAPPAHAQAPDQKQPTPDPIKTVKPEPPTPPVTAPVQAAPPNPRPVPIESKNEVKVVGNDSKPVATASNELKNFEAVLNNAKQTEVKVDPAADVKVPVIPPKDAAPPTADQTKSPPPIFSEPKKIEPAPPAIVKNVEPPAVVKVDPKTQENKTVPPPAPPTEAPKVNPAPGTGADTAKVSPAPAPVLSGDPAKQGEQLMKAGDFKSAVEVLKKANQDKPKDEGIMMNLAIAMFEAADYDRAGTLAAMEKFTDVIQANPENAEALMYGGHCNARMERMQEAAQFYRKGYQVGGENVGWHPKWQLGTKYLHAQDYAGALDVLSMAEEGAASKGVKDPRLLRAMAEALHGAKKDDEAIKRVNALVEMGYTPDAKLVAELKNSSQGAALKGGNVAVTQNTTPAAPTQPDVKKETAPVSTKVEIVKTKEPEKVADKALEAPKLTPNPVADAIKNGTAVVGVNNVPAAPGGKAPGAKEEVKPVQAPASAPAAQRQTVDDLNKVKPEDLKTTPRPPKPTLPEPPKEPAKEATPKARKAPPVVPAKFEDAMAAAQRALAEGAKIMEQAGSGEKREAARQQAQEHWDEAEAMLRGAWNMKPENPEVSAQFEELAKQVGVIALVKQAHLLSRPKGLVVLNAEPSIVFPKDKSMYYAWEQVEGKDLGLRREDLNKKQVGLKIKDPGVYKFELTVSDGARGGNPVMVTVTIAE